MRRCCVRATRLLLIGCCLLTCGWLLAGCGDAFALFLNQSASLGGGQNAIDLGDADNDFSPRGLVRVLFINNTPYRAAFTAGTFDQLDRSGLPDLVQFGVDSGEANLEGNDSTIVGNLNCGRVLGVGSPRLLSFVRENTPVPDRLDSATHENVEFYDVDDEGNTTFVGIAAGIERLIGVDFACEGLLIFRFEIDDVGENPFRITFEVIPSESTRGPGN